MRIITPFIAVAAIALATPALAQNNRCEHPTLPVKPAGGYDVPDCVNLDNNTHTCRPDIINKFEADRKAHNEGLVAHADALNEYLDGTEDFVHCEVGKINVELGG